MKTLLHLSVIVLFIFHFNVCKGIPIPDCATQGGEAPVFIYNSPYTILENGDLCCDPYSGPTTCRDEKELADKCQGRGLVDEPCHFCKTCARLAGETCGGDLHYEYGRCDEGLECLNGTERKNGTNGIGTCYRIATKLLGEVCGGRYGESGRCSEGLRCNISDTSDKDIEGICFSEDAPGACFKNCRERDETESCGSDGRWYRNKCELRQQNCLIPPGRQPHTIKPEKDNTICEQACKDVNITDINAVVSHYTNGVRNGSLATIGCQEGYKLIPSTVTLLCLPASGSSSSKWHRQIIDDTDGSVTHNIDYYYSCAKIQTPYDISDSDQHHN